MATFVMQSLGCEVTSINTVQYSNHTGYKQWKGRKTSAAEITELYDGLKQAHLTDSFDVLLTGYIPSADAVTAVGKIGRDLRFHSGTRPGSFFWVLDPVMGDNGRLYVPEDIVPQYRALLRDADLLLPNHFEAELLANVSITDLHSLGVAVATLHRTYRVPHLIITSLRLPPENTDATGRQDSISIVGSTSTAAHRPRLWRIDVPLHPIFFSGTGDMFAALMVARLREAVAAAGVQDTSRWKSGDDVPATELPLARACEKVLASMSSVLEKTARARDEVVRKEEEEEEMKGPEGAEERERWRHLRRTRAAEVRVVRNARDLREPVDLEKFRAREITEEEMGGIDETVGEPEKDGLGVTNVAGGGDGAVMVERGEN